jgi:regulator of protease activity HflC (stomatin/prohibitin superfamily)
MEKAQSHSLQSPDVVPRSHRLIRRLLIVYGSALAATVALLCAAFLPASVFPQTYAIARELVDGSGGAAVLTALLLATATLLGTFALTTARLRYSLLPAAQRAARGSRAWSLANPGFAARQGQAIVVTTATLLIWLAVRVLWPSGAATASGVAANVAGAFAVGLAFVSLVAERVMDEFPEPQLPEAPQLRRILLLATIVLGLAACVEFARAAGIDWFWLYWAELVLICVPGVIAAELTLHALARLFLPPRSAADAHAATDSILATLITGGRHAPGTLLKTHFGLDFARSWALKFLTAAILPAVLATGLFCWGLSGLKLIDLGQRGVYERFGAPVSVLGPGLHMLLPWPLGRLRPVEYGTIHALAVGVDQNEPAAEEIAVGAEETTPVALNRLWETSHPGQANYLVPSPGTGQQGFQSVSTEISVLYRVGLTDDAALKSVYAVSDPAALVKSVADRLVLQFFNSRTLDAVLGARRENVADSLRDALQRDVDAYSAGIDIVSVLIEEIHPPAGAAAAYHAVQAAEINANASIFDETGRAKRTAGIAQQEAHQLTAAAKAQAAETLHTADAEAYRFGADRRAYGDGGQAFLLERSYANLRTALGKAPLTIIDHRLSAADGPVIDLRSSAPGAAGANRAQTAPAAPAPAQPTVTPGIEDAR